jgi:hypothetical protein
LHLFHGNEFDQTGDDCARSRFTEIDFFNVQRIRIWVLVDLDYLAYAEIKATWMNLVILITGVFFWRLFFRFLRLFAFFRFCSERKKLKSVTINE